MADKGDVVKEVAKLIHLEVYQSGGELHEWGLCKQEHYIGVAIAILRKIDEIGG